MSLVLKIINLPFKKLLACNLNNSRALSTVNKDLIKTSASNIQNADLLFNNLKGSGSVQNVLELVNTHYKIMNTQHIMQALRTIFVLQKQGRAEISTKQLLSHPDFEQICNKLRLLSGVIEVNDSLEAFKVLTFIGVPSNSTIYQTVLQLIRFGINNLSLSQIIFLDFLLKKAQKTPLSEAILLALPIVFEIQLPVKVDYNNITLLTDSLFYVSRKNISNKCIELICNSLLKHRLNSRNALSVVWSLCEFPPDEMYETLLKRTIKIIVQYENEFNQNELETTLSKLISRHSMRYPFYYDEDFFEVCLNRAMDKDAGFERAVHLLRKTSKLGYFNRNLIEYTTQKFYQNPDLIKVGDPQHVYSVVCALGMTEYVPKHIDLLRKTLMEMDLNHLIDHDVSLLRFTASLCVLDVYRPDLLEMTLQPEFISKRTKKGYLTDLKSAILISQLIKTFKPKLLHLLPGEDVLGAAKLQIKPTVGYPLQGVLHNIFGGSNFVRTNVQSRMHHQIDHVIVIKKGGFPVGINKSEIYLEDISVDSNSQIILILVLPSQNFTINTRQMKADTALTIKVLEANGRSVVPIDFEIWSKLQDFEKIPYIMEKIKEKTEFMERVSNWS